MTNMHPSHVRRYDCDSTCHRRETLNFAKLMYIHNFRLSPGSVIRENVFSYCYTAGLWTLLSVLIKAVDMTGYVKLIVDIQILYSPGFEGTPNKILIGESILNIFQYNID